MILILHLEGDDSHIKNDVYYVNTDQVLFYTPFVKWIPPSGEGEGYYADKPSGTTIHFSNTPDADDACITVSALPDQIMALLRASGVKVRKA